MSIKILYTPKILLFGPLCIHFLKVGFGEI